VRRRRPEPSSATVKMPPVSREYTTRPPLGEKSPWRAAAESPDDSRITRVHDVEAVHGGGASRGVEEDCLAIWRPGERADGFAARGEPSALLPIRGCRHEVRIAPHLDAERET